jgi:ActR/RegA family two-component response regulator
MTASTLALPVTNPADPLKRKRVLLVDASAPKRELRAEALKKLGIDVDCACDITEARSWWRAALYNLVLVNLENELGSRDKFCDDLRSATPPQQLAFLVGGPEYLAGSPGSDAAAESMGSRAPQNGSKPAHAGTSVDSPLPWGILEASRRISAVRSASVARSQAIRNRPTPPRDLEARFSKRAEAESQLLPELELPEIKLPEFKKEEMQ